MRKKEPFASVGDILGKWLKGRKWDSKLRQYSLFSRWPEIVGTKIASKSRPALWREETLVVEVQNSVWLTELRMMEPEILEKIRGACPEIAIKKIRFTIAGSSG